jgi:hypothetical protein
MVRAAGSPDDGNVSRNSGSSIGRSDGSAFRNTTKTDPRGPSSTRSSVRPLATDVQPRPALRCPESGHQNSGASPRASAATLNRGLACASFVVFRWQTRVLGSPMDEVQRAQVFRRPAISKSDRRRLPLSAALLSWAMTNRPRPMDLTWTCVRPGLTGTSLPPQSSSANRLISRACSSWSSRPGERIGLWWPTTVAPSATSARILFKTSKGIWSWSGSARAA